MKIGILTFHRAINYGAFLQAFSLKNYLEKNGYSVILIDYWPKAHANAYQLFDWNEWCKRNTLRKIYSLVKFLFSYTRSRKRKDKMGKLLYMHFNLNEQPVFENPHELINVNCDCVVYGSDQIWWKSRLIDYEGFDSAYWGEYVSFEIKKIAYAPSMGKINLSTNDCLEIKKHLNNFDSISVRENGLKKEISHLTDKNMSVVLDPVFLSSQETWSEFCIPIHQKKYLLYYRLGVSSMADKLVDKLKKEMHLSVIEVTGSVNPFKFGSRYVQTLDAIEFISLVKSADFVVTTSFHGTAFSVLFEKQFYSLGMGDNSGRVSSLLSLIGLENRLLEDVEHAFNERIDYSLVTPKLVQNIKESEKFILSALS